MSLPFYLFNHYPIKLVHPLSILWVKNGFQCGLTLLLNKMYIDVSLVIASFPHPLGFCLLASSFHPWDYPYYKTVLLCAPLLLSSGKIPSHKKALAL